MAIRFTKQNTVDSIRRNTAFSGDAPRTYRTGKHSDLTNLVLTEQARSTAPLREISHVVLMGTCFQMGRVYARWIVTLMQYVQALWNRAIMQFIGKPMDVCKDALIVQLAVALPMLTACPKPAGFRLLNLAPKAILNRYVTPFVSASMRTILNWLTLVPDRYLATKSTNTLNRISSLAVERKSEYPIHANSPYLRVSRTGSGDTLPGLSVSIIPQRVGA